MKKIELKYAKRLALTVFTFLILGAGPFTANVQAQNASVFEVEVPFDFVVMGRTYAAATYKIGRLSQGSPDTLVLNSSSGKTLLMFQTQRLSSGTAAEFSRLTFIRNGETNTLESIIASGERHESRLPWIKSERHRQEIAQTSQTVRLYVK